MDSLLRVSLTLAGSEVLRFDEDAARARGTLDAAPVVVRPTISAAELVRRAAPGQHGRVARPRTVHTDRRRRGRVHDAPLTGDTRKLVTRQTLYTQH